MPDKSKNEVARYLAQAHARVEQTISKVIRVLSVDDEERTDEPIKLLEVNSASVPYGILPIYFGATEDAPYPLIIIEVTPTEFDEIQKHHLNLRKGWTLGETLV